MRLRHTAIMPMIVLATLVACDHSATAPNTGRLSVTIGGLPVGAPPSVAITGPRAYNHAIESSTTIAELREGTYTIVASPVTVGGTRYAAVPASQTAVVSASGLTVAAAITYAPATSRLAVNIIGLPVGVQANVTVRDPSGGSRIVGLSTHLELLAPGAYTISAADVQGTGKTYRPSPTTQQVTLVATTTEASVTVAYGAGSATLDLTVLGLPSGTNASISLTGPAGYTRALTSSTSVVYLEAGTYTIAAGVVGSNLTTYSPAPASQTVSIVDATTSTASVSYGASPLALALRLHAQGLTEPVFLTAPDGDARQFIVERNGRIRIVENGALLATPFLDISSRVNFVGERGMLSMAFDPLYATNGRFFVYYVDLGGFMVVESFGSTSGSNVAGATNGIVIRIPHDGENHHGGQIAFGPDRMLYVAPGDGGCCGDPQNNAQNMATLLGKILRLDVRTFPYTVPGDNPFVGGVFERPEIWASGLRNPWRYSFDAPSGMLYIGDVGQDSREEVDVVSATAKGLNYGWRLMEGSACYNPTTACNPGGGTLTLPVQDYPHSEGCSVIGGYVYRGSDVPELTGHYLYSDFCGGWLRSFRSFAGGATDQRSWPGVSLVRGVSFGRDGAGELYMIGAGRVWKIVRQ
jgi:glucose/arabinose dehydrogenase